MPLCKVSTVDAAEIKTETANTEAKAATEETPSLDVEASDVTKASGSNSNCPYKGDWSWGAYRGTGVKQSALYDDIFKQAGKEIGLHWVLVAAHSKQESSWITDSKNKGSSAGGLFGIIDSTWKSNAPQGYSDPSNKYKPEIAVKCYINIMKKNMNKFKGAASQNDQILLAIQLYHDGSFPSTATYANYKVPQYLLDIDKKKKNHNCEKEAKEYIPKIMAHYEKMGGKIH